MTPAFSHLLATPDAALLAIIAGILLLYLEFNIPGTVLPGCLGALVLMLGLFALSHLPLRPAALGLTLLGFALLLLAIVLSRALLPTTLGFTLLTTAFLRLVGSSQAARPISLPAALLAALLFSASTVWLGRVAFRARRNKQIVPRPSPAPQSRLNVSDLW